MQTRTVVSALFTVAALLLWPGISRGVEALLADDAYTHSGSPNTNFGAAGVLFILNPTQKSFIKFDLATLPSGVTGLNVLKANLKLYLRAVTTGGSFDVKRVLGAWTESGITHNNAPSLGSTPEATVTVAASDINNFILIDLTTLVKDWIDGILANNGFALTPTGGSLNIGFNSKEDTSTSHEPRLEVVLGGL